MKLTKHIHSLLLTLLSFSHFASNSQDMFEPVSLSNDNLTLNQSAHGIAIADYDNDGDDDFLILNNQASEAIKLFNNEGDFVFKEVASSAGIDVRYKSRTAIWFDADNDGWLDLLIASENITQFFYNLGDGTFEEKSTSSGLGNSTSTMAIVAGDLNGDQWIDIYCANLFEENGLFLNHGNLSFHNHIDQSGGEIGQLQSMGTVLFDLEKDGDLDIYCVYDINKPNKLFVNDGMGHFEDQAADLNVDHAGFGMGVDFADFNLDGRSDLYLSYFHDNKLYEQNANGTFTDQAPAAGIASKGMSWGTAAADFNNDSYPDIIVGDGISTSGTNQLFQNNADGTFTNVLKDVSWATKSNTLACAYSDLNNDGAIDLIIANSDSPGIQIIKNNQLDNHWIQLSLVSNHSNKFGIGARVEITVDGKTLSDELTAGSGYATQNSSVLSFGLGTNSSIESLTIYWPSGQAETYPQLSARQKYLAIEGQGIQLFDKDVYQEALSRSHELVLPTLTIPQLKYINGHSIARIWNESLLSAIRNDLARPTVHARNLFHLSVAMYDSWAVYEPNHSPYLLGNNTNGFTSSFLGIEALENTEEARLETMSYAAFRLLNHRFKNSVSSNTALDSFVKIFEVLGYDPSILSQDYTVDGPAALGNFIAQQIIDFGLQDGSNESDDYANQFYSPSNEAFWPLKTGNPTITDPNHWQPLAFESFIDQSGNEIGGGIPEFLSAEWGEVTPFALSEEDKNTFSKGDHTYTLYHDPGHPPYLQENGTEESAFYKWNFELVAQWSSHLDPMDETRIDISPKSQGNISTFPSSISEYKTFYEPEGGDTSLGYEINPFTNEPYETQLVKRGDYARVLAEFWADGPDSETPPGHWFTLLNYVSDHPLFEKRFEGQGPIIEDLEWEVKSYFTLGGAMHDAAITAWSIKGYYDYIRPISVIRYMAQNGQSSDVHLPNYHEQGILLIDDYIELIKEGDPLAEENSAYLHQIKVKCWKGPEYIQNPTADVAGVDWILGSKWSPYQRSTFVTPPFAGYISGHSTFSRAAAEVITKLTGDPFFPGGMSDFLAKKNEFLIFEDGPSEDITLQWAKYSDAADQCSLSRIWGGIHPPIDDIPGRIIGTTVGLDAFEFAKKYFNKTTLTTSKVENENSDWIAYPNPVEGRKLKIRMSDSDKPIQLTLRELSGKTLRNESLSQKNTYTLDLTGIFPGIYLLKIGTQTKKIIIP